ncbi:hypothetical protein DsansV1_C24g0182641 [Dioscorea sansibarensis]
MMNPSRCSSKLFSWFCCGSTFDVGGAWESDLDTYPRCCSSGFSDDQTRQQKHVVKELVCGDMYLIAFNC